MAFPFKTKLTLKSSLFLRRVVYTPSDLDPVRTLLIRLGMVLFLFGMLIGVLWLDREGLKDQSDGHISLTDVVYFTMVTVTTVGYGDIVPVTPRARMIDALVVTPVRIFIWIIFLGTAYQLALRQFTEVFRMAKLQSNLDQHVVVCGFGHTGYSAVKELLAKGTDPEHIVVIDPHDDRVRTAVELGVVALKGDATQEGSLGYKGKMVSIGVISGIKAELNLALMMVKRQQIIGSVLRSRPVPEKAEIVAEFTRRALPKFADRTIVPIIEKVFTIDEVVEAHRMMEEDKHFGKIVLKVAKD